jgi:hypothetical protein
MNSRLGEGPMDGSWWPQSRDISVELSDLVDHFPSEHGEVYRAVFSRPDWDTAPHRVQVHRGPIKVGSFPGDDTHQIWLTMSNRRMIGLSVKAPDGSAPATAHEARANDASPAGSDEGDRHWSDDGGSWLSTP